MVCDHVIPFPTEGFEVAELHYQQISLSNLKIELSAQITVLFFIRGRLLKKNLLIIIKICPIIDENIISDIDFSCLIKY